MLVPSNDDGETISLATASIAPVDDNLQIAATVTAVSVTERVPISTDRDNFSAPIHTVPFEILSEIFADVINLCGLYTPASYTNGLHILDQVCTRWANIILQTPRLWTVVTSHQKPQQWRMALELSRTSPLTIHVRASSLAGDVQDPLPFLQVISPHVHRFEAVSAEFFDLDVYLPHLRLDEASLLRSLRYQAHRTRERHSFHPTLAQASRIFHLELRDIIMSINNLQSFTALLHLHLSRIDDVTSTTIIFDILRANPNLGHLAFTKLVVVGGAPPLEHPIMLSRLLFLKMERMDGSIMEELAIAIKTPVCVNFRFVRSPTPIPPSFLNTISSHMASTFVPSLDACDRIEVNITGEKYSVYLTVVCLSSSRSIHAVALDGFSDIVDALAFAVGRLLSGLPHIPIWLRYNARYRSSQSLLESLPLLRHLPSIQRLSLKCILHVTASVLEQLIAPIPSGEESAGIGLCPEMEELEVINFTYSDCEALVRLVQSRSVEAVARLPRETRFAALRTLRLRGGGGIDDAAFDCIRGFLGEGASWD